MTAEMLVEFNRLIAKVWSTGPPPAVLLYDGVPLSEMTEEELNNLKNILVNK